MRRSSTSTITPCGRPRNPGPLDPHCDTIPVHDLAELLAGQINRRSGIVRHQPAVTIAMGADRPDDETGQLFAQAILTATVLHHVATQHEAGGHVLDLGRGRRAEHGLQLVETQRASGLAQRLQQR
jgi:hypothetical protein